jgi:hypothetical protein
MSEVKEATERELAILVDKPTARKGKAEAAAKSFAAYMEEIAALERHLDIYEAFMKVWEPKLQRWDSFIEELHKAEIASEDEGGDGATETGEDQNTPLQLTGPGNTVIDG